MQKSRVVEFFFDWQFEVEKKSTNGSLLTNKTLIHIVYMYCKLWGRGNLSHKVM